MCDILQQTKPPQAGKNYGVSFIGVPPIEWRWFISGDGSDSGTEQGTAGSVVIPIPKNTEGEILTFQIKCGTGNTDAFARTIE